jgi:hypothetical protein
LGPIYPVSPSIHLQGVFPNAVVTITGSQSGNLASVTYSSEDPDTWLPITKEPLVGEYIVVTQSINGVDSGESAGANDEAIVQAVPNPLPIPEITQHLPTCSDWIVFDNLIPGGTIIVELQGLTILKAPIATPLQEFRINPKVLVAIGDIFEAYQTVAVSGGLLSSDSVKSLPVENLNLPSTLPTPGMQPQPIACTANATFENLIVGATLAWTNQGSGTWSVDSVDSATEGWNWGGPALTAGAITAQQSFNKCHISSPVFTGTVLPAPPLEAPQVPDQLCSDVTKFHVSGLNTPCTLYIQGTIPCTSSLCGSSNATTIMQTREWAATQETMDIPIPADWYGLPSASFQFSQQTACGQSPESKTLTIKTLSSVPAPVVVAPIYQCARFIHIQQATPDCMMYARTADWIIMSDNFTVTQSDFYIHTDALYQPLYQTESIVVVEWGCGQDVTSTAVQVTPVAMPNHALPVPTITNVLRPGNTVVDVSGVYPGAEVSILVNGQYFDPATFAPWAVDVEALTTTPAITMNQPLVAGQSILAVQSMCGNVSSTTSTAATTVDKATLHVMASPGAFTKGQTVSLVVQATDPQTGDSDDPNWGEVSWDSDTFKLGSAITQTISANDPRSSIVGMIAGTAYNNPATFVTTLDAAPPPIFTFYLNAGPLDFGVYNSSVDANDTVYLSSVTWTVSPQWAAGQKVSLTASPNLAYLTANHPFTDPPASAKGVTDFLQITGTATFNDGGSYSNIPLAGEFERDPSSTAATACMVWNLAYTIDDGNVIWPDGQEGFGPINGVSGC